MGVAVATLAGFDEASTGRGCADTPNTHRNDTTIKKYIRFMEIPILKKWRRELSLLNEL